MSVLDKIKSLTDQLYPTGRAFRSIAGVRRKVRDGLAASEARFYDDLILTLDSILADNSNFTADDATAWERRLGLITGDGVPLEDRKLAILRKYNHPGEIKAREHYLFLQKQLRDAGFDVYVHENRFAYGDGTYYTLSPRDIDPGFPLIYYQHSPFIQHGNLPHGVTIGNKIVNHLSQSLDDQFDIGSSFRSSFFIGGPYLGQYAIVPEVRKMEFRQLILRVKPVQTVGFLFVVYSY